MVISIDNLKSKKVTTFIARKLRIIKERRTAKEMEFGNRDEIK